MASLNARPVAKATALVAVAATFALATVAACTPSPAPSLTPEPPDTRTVADTVNPTNTPEIDGAWRSPTPGPSPTPFPDSDVDAGKVLRLTWTADTESEPTWSPDGKKIAFVCYSDGWRSSQLDPSANPRGDTGGVRNWNIYSYHYSGAICVMNADGAGHEQLTDLKADALDPAWSPDGSKIAFSSRPDRNRDIYVINADGTGLRQVTDDEYPDEGPTWSPDGTKIAFASARDESYDIYVMNIDGSNRTQITDGSVDYYEPAWSPDGNLIAFSSRSGIFVIKPDGTEQPTQLSDLGSLWHKQTPTWSPDSQTIAFASKVRHEWYYDYEIYTVNISGYHSELKRLTYRRGEDFNPAWSPDGTKLAFVSMFQRHPEIYVLVDFQTYLQRLTDNSYSDTAPSWSPDGTRIAFASDRGGDDELYVMNADGTGVTQLTDNDDKQAYGPTWSPDGRRIAYQSGASFDTGGHYDIYIINEDGSGNVKLTSHDIIATTRLNGVLTWSPDGTRIAYLSNLNGQYQVYIMNSDGTDQVGLNVEDCRSYAAARGYDPHWSHEDTGISWSPDGSRLVLSCLDSNLRLIDPSGETQTEFYACNDQVSAPEWSPDGTRIAFTCPHLESGRNDIHIYDLIDDYALHTTIEEESEPRSWLPPHATPVFMEKGDDAQPAWSPDGTKIAFASDRDGDYEIYVLDLTLAPTSTRGIAAHP